MTDGLEHSALRVSCNTNEECLNRMLRYRNLTCISSNSTKPTSIVIEKVPSMGPGDHRLDLTWPVNQKAAPDKKTREAIKATILIQNRNRQY